MSHSLYSRRRFIKNSSAAAAMVGLTGIACANQSSGPDHRLGVALLGLGGYATGQLGPALLHTKYCRLAGIITGSPDKVPEWQEKYGLSDKSVYSYDDMDRIADDDDIDIVYVVTPNALHLPYAERAAAAGKHVICEKPMEISSERCRQMMAACERAGVKLQIGYRLQYDPYHHEMIRLAQEEVHGKLKQIHSAFSFFGVHGSNWRFTDRSLAGGGPMMDLGVYPLQATRYINQAEPLSVTAQQINSYPDRMDGMEETIMWQMRFPNDVLTHSIASYAARDNYLTVNAEKGRYGLTTAYTYGPLAGYVNGDDLFAYDHRQQTAQMDAFALNILKDTPVKADGQEGLRDVICIEAIYEAARTGREVKIDMG